ncbi:MAG: hypothetical protein ACRDPR_03110, partial [Nocardioidaceae bacterium]
LVTVALSQSLLALPEARRRLLETSSGPGIRESLDLTLDRGLYGTTPTGSWWWLAVRSPHTAAPLDLAHTIGTSLLVIGVCLLAARLLPRLFAVAFGAGTMTLTLYSAHVALRSPGAWDGSSPATYLWQVGAVLVVGAAFRVAGRRGPLEAVLAAVAVRVRRAAAGTRLR